ncbi:uncharacterized protein LOC111693223 [Trichogramma pretiosum]|uniref:uncharacterized protein LOC111693223 n=1 Tax=Trichogramma pretiosum TaxID=7493 RepID=UPI000C71C5FA|nr:uncharacterized protein LOC111693223 [Trichogramma pretiosum]
MESSCILNSAVRVKEEANDVPLTENGCEMMDEKPDLKNIQLLPFVKENSSHTTLRKCDIKLKSELDEDMGIVFECKDVKPNMNLSVVKKIDDCSPNHLQNVKDDSSCKNQNIIKVEHAEEVKKEFCGDALEESNLNFDCEFNDDIEVIVECEDMKPNVDVSAIKKIDDDSQNHLRNVEDSDEIQNAIIPETTRKVKKEIFDYDTEQFVEQNEKIRISKKYNNDHGLKTHICMVHNDTTHPREIRRKKCTTKKHLKTHIDSVHRKTRHCTIELDMHVKHVERNT